MNDYTNILTLRNESRAASALWREIELKSELIHNTYRDYALSRGDAWDTVGPEANRLKKWYLSQDFAVAAITAAYEAGDAFKKGRVTYREDIIDMMNEFALRDLFATEALAVTPYGSSAREPLLRAQADSIDKLHHFEHSFWEIWYEHQRSLAMAFAAESIHPTVRYAMNAEREQYEYDAGYGWHDEDESPDDEMARFKLEEAILAAASMKPDAEARLAAMSMQELADEYLAVRNVLDLLREYLAPFCILTNALHETVVRSNAALVAVEYALFKRDHVAYYAWYLEQKRSFHETDIHSKYPWVAAAISKDDYDDNNEEGEW